MTKYHQLIQQLLMAPEFREAIQAALAEPAEHLLSQMRATIRQGDAVKAAWCEGQVVGLESVVSLLESYVRRGNKAGPSS